MKSTPGWWKRYWETSSVGSGMTWSASGGRPAASPASWSSSTARTAQRAARAEGRKIIALRVLAATIDLNSAVEVGFVIGSSASTTPIGSATYSDPALGVLVDHADRGLVLEVVVEELGGDVVLDHLVLEHAEAGLLHRQLGQLDGVLEAGHRHRPHDPVNGLLVQAPERPRRLRARSTKPSSRGASAASIPARRAASGAATAPSVCTVALTPGAFPGRLFRQAPPAPRPPGRSADGTASS